MKKTFWNIVAWSVFTLTISAIPWLTLRECREMLRQMRGQNHMAWMQMDMLMRVYHHAAPHKAHTQQCPECFDAKRKSYIRATEEKPIKTLKGLEPIH